MSVASIALLAALLGMGIGSSLLLFGAAGIATLSAAHYAGAHRSALREREEQLAEVAARLDRADAEHRSARARMHEIRSTVAGIASATQLLKSLPEERRESFESMVDAEMDRLIRILRDDDAADPRLLALDELIDNLVTSHRARGRTVRWERSGLRAIGRYDDIAEAVNVLIDNAAVHGSSDDIRVAAEHRDQSITVTVTDTGPGVPVELRDRIFHWGEQREDSPGQGIGLNVAQALIRELGGDLVLDPDYRNGARFVVTLPAAPRPVRVVGDQLRVAS